MDSSIKFTILWCLCGVFSILLGLLMHRLRNPGINMKKVAEICISQLPICFLIGPLLLMIGIVQFFIDIPQYKTKSEYVLGKFES